MQTHYIRVFISHSWAYSEHYDKLAEWIFKTSWNSNGMPLVFHDNSVPKDDPIHNARNTDELQIRIYELIDGSDVVVIPTGMYSSYSTWIQKELDGAAYYGKPVLGVNPRGQLRKSSVVQEAARETVGWTSDSVVGGIFRLHTS